MIIFTDIDDTLMKTERKIKGDASQLKVGALNKNGEPISFMDKKREKLVDQFLGNAISIPVTARSKDGFKNLQIKFNHHAVLNFGATILNADGNLDANWYDYIKKLSKKQNQEKTFDIVSKNIVSALKKHKEYYEEKNFKDEKNKKSFEVRIVIEDGIHTFMNFRDFYPNIEKRKILKQEIDNIIRNNDIENEFYIYETDRDLALIPNFISKRLGVEYLLNEHYSCEDVIIGLGDNKNDMSFMSLCDFVMFPTDSMLNQCLERGMYV